MKAFLRRFVFLCLAAALVFSSVVPAFAAGNVTVTDISELSSYNGFFTKVLQPVPGSDGGYSVSVKLSEKASEEEQQIWKECMQGVASGEWTALFVPVGSPSRGDVNISFFHKVEVSASSDDSGYAFQDGFIFFKTYHFIFYNIDGSVNFNNFLGPSPLNLNSSGGKAYYTTDPQFILDHADSFRYDFTLVDGIDFIAITDDLEDTSEPEPEPEPEPKPPYIPELPEIPQGGEYVPYDTSIWEKFLAHVKGGIGGATTVGFLILAMILGVLIVIRIVKYFSKP